jgi:NADPH:quinone reductase-like Zn-dependent oxidoreductase
LLLEGVDHVIENSGNCTIAKSVAPLKHGGSIALVGVLSYVDQANMPDMVYLALTKGATIRGINVGSKQLFDELFKICTC